MNFTVNSQRVRLAVLGGLFAPLVFAQTAPSDEVLKLDAFTVTGSNLSRALEEASVPMSTFSPVDIEALGASTIADIVAALPFSQNIGFNETSTGPNDARGDVATINLRNLGTGRTLVLLNGRRMSAHGVTPGTPPIQFVNLNSIPVAAVSQIDILRDGASAIYGSDAIGGVMNTRLRRDFTGVELSVKGMWGDPAPNDYTVDLSGGFASGDDRTHLGIFLSYFKREHLAAADRPYAADADKRLIVDEPFASNSRFNRMSSSGPEGRFTAQTDSGATVGVPGVTPTSGSARGRFYVDPETGQLSSGTGPSAFYDFQEDGWLLPDTERLSLFTTIDHEVSEVMDLFAELSFYQADSHGQTAATPISSGTDGVVVPKTNYYNPVGSRFYGPGTANPSGTPRDVLIRNYRPTEIGPRTYDTSLESYRGVVGLRGRIASGWDWETAVLHMTGKTDQVNNNYMSQSLLEAQLALDTPDAFNPFGGANANSPAQYENFVIDIWDRGTGTVTSWDGKISGDMVDLPAGPMATVMGVEVRNESMKQVNDPFGLADDVIAQSEQIDINASRRMYGFYTESLLPLVSESNRASGVHSLDLRVAARYENYEDFDALKPAAALSWRIYEGLMIRASYNEGFRAPSVAELYQPQRARRNDGLIDGARTGEEDAEGTVTKRVVTGGNPTLQPEESQSYNIGFVLDVPKVEGLSLSMDVFQIESTDRIDNPDAQDELDMDEMRWLANGGSNPRVLREARTAADVAAGIPGRLIEIQGTYYNLQSRTIEGVDASLVWVMPATSIGRFTFKAEGTYTSKLEDIDRDGNVSNPIRQGGNPRTKGLISASWRRGDWSAYLSGKYISDYENSSTYDTTDANGDVQKIILDAQWIANASVGYRFGEGSMLHGTSVRVGVNNLLDEAPPLYLSASDGYDSSYHDAKGRQWFVQLTHKF
ncbi:TonB-dependent receptor domain-containing protein [Synoicihabitans lomoniglobus]|uniref:TonB-dependent receptor n=1 Tax=Synoicihabitans lomoniglobus TaxID=2909285 RepID=A0AAF0I6E4_9BACT|nr:TonB-dependent receptor [Opitutaceae bacterium LMO-M01]WED66046.1 TonB-dependent receptor [Opitutaceae bacterium LMO-M01]